MGIERTAVESEGFCSSGMGSGRLRGKWGRERRERMGWVRAAEKAVGGARRKSIGMMG